ncbi:myosin-2 heavy chain non muscle [Biomphalaria pfeifferi]|uniref:Myosin-2 heavy chain non muscle n=1 Tax=Biomphalaria pfeifferi TaxID=112525 RepID=A0AAD8BH24_BIOPF|nr:myosin-2 heavy chain non muscle [Biomphalaria pfeifferi]
MADFLKQTHELLLSSQAEVVKVVNEFVLEISKKYKTYIPNSKTDKKQKAFHEVKTWMDDAMKKLNFVIDYLSGPDSDKLIDKVVNTSVSLSSADSDRIRQLMTRFDVMEKAMCGYQNDNADIRETQTKMDDKLKSMSELLQKTIDRTDLKQMSLEKRVAQLSETLDKEKDNLGKRLTAHENETKDFIKKELLGNMKRDETIQTLEKKTTELSAALIETYTSTVACVNDINAHIDSLSNHLSEHNQALNDLATRCDNSQRTENLLKQQIEKHGDRIEVAERKLQSADLELKMESKKVDANSKNIHNLSDRLEKLNAGLGDVKDKHNGVSKTLQSEQKKLERLKEEWDNVKAQASAASFLKYRLYYIR